MRLRAYIYIFLAAILVLSVADLHAGLIVVDRFTNPGTSDQSIVVTAKKLNSHSELGIGSVLGGYRNIALWDASGQPVFVDVFGTDDGDPGLFFTQGTGAGTTTVTWSGSTSTTLAFNLGSRDLTDSGTNNKFDLTIGGVTGTGVDAKLIVYSNDGSHASTATFSISAAGDILIPFYTSFSATGSSGGASFTDIDAIQLILDGTQHVGNDVAITSLTVIPEPSTLLLAAIGAVAFLGAGRKWREA